MCLSDFSFLFFSIFYFYFLIASINGLGQNNSSVTHKFMMILMKCTVWDLYLN